jgi:hypothetical protein
MTAETRAEAGATCIPNIGPLGRQRRMRSGLWLLAVGAVVSGALVAWGGARPWRLLILPVFWAAATGVFQAREKT